MVLSEQKYRFNNVFVKVGYVGAKIRPSPNMWTFLNLLCGTAAALMILYGRMVSGAVLLLASGFLDIIDGSVAAVCKKVTDFGAVFDRVTDKYVEGLIILAIAYQAPDFILPSLVWGFVAIWGGILLSSVSDLGSRKTERKAFRLVGRAERILILTAGLLASFVFGEIYLAYTLIVLGVLAHVSMLIATAHYYIILR